MHKSIDVAEFRAKGYAVIHGVFPRDEAEQIRNETIELASRIDAAGEAWIEEGSDGRAIHPQADMLTYEPLRRVLLDARLLGAVREILGGDPSYWGESSVVVGSWGGARAWHTDAYDTPVTHGPRYPLIRCGLYLQDTAHHSGGLAVRAGTHAATPSVREKIRSRLRTKLVATTPGDLVVWDMRTLHAGEVVRLRPAPSLALPLGLQGRLPKSLRLPEERERVVMFPTFGLPGADLDSWLEYQRSREYTHPIWRASRFPQSVWDEASAARLNIVRPIPEYGTTSEDTATVGYGA